MCEFRAPILKLSVSRSRSALQHFHLGMHGLDSPPLNRPQTGWGQYVPLASAPLGRSGHGGVTIQPALGTCSSALCSSNFRRFLHILRRHVTNLPALILSRVARICGAPFSDSLSERKDSLHEANQRSVASGLGALPARLIGARTRVDRG